MSQTVTAIGEGVAGRVPTILNQPKNFAVELASEYSSSPGFQ
jgi:hypothetical protein